MRFKFPYMSPEGDGTGTGTEGGGGGGTQFDPAAAKTFLADFVPDAKLLDSMPEPELKSYHERVSGKIKTDNWPDKWRELASAKDEKKLQRLSRYASPNAAIDALLAAQNKISESGLKEPFPEKGTPEQQAAWREANSVPVAPDKYDLTGLPVNDDNKERVGEFLKFAHGLNLNQSQVTNYLKWSSEAAKKDDETLANSEKVLAEATQDTLRTEWGADYKSNMNKIHGLLDTAPEGIKESFLGGRLASGEPIFANANALRWLANLALEINPATTLVPASGGDIAGAVGDELTKIEKLMGNTNSEYWKGPGAAKMQDRYRQLVDAKNKLAAKGKAA